FSCISICLTTTRSSVVAFPYTTLLRSTSNPGARDFQDLVSGGRTLYMHVAERVAGEWNADGQCMLVIGATYPKELAEVRARVGEDRKSTRLNSSHVEISYAVFFLLKII